MGLLGPLLQKPSENPHATLVTLFMNAIAEAEHSGRTPGRNSVREEMDVMSRYPIVRNTCKNDMAGIGLLVMMAAMPLGKNVDKLFDQ